MPFNVSLGHSLKSRVTLFTLAILLLCVWSLTFYVSIALRQDMQRLAGDQQFSTVSFMTAGINGEMTDRMNALKMIAAAIDAHMLDNPAVLQAHVEQRPVLQILFNAGIFVTRLDGTAVAELPLIGRVGVNYMDRDHVSAALKEGKASVGTPIVGKKVRSPSFAITVPIRDAQGKVIGALVGATDLERPNFLDKVSQGRFGKTGGYLLIEPQRRLIVTASDKRRVMEQLPTRGVIPAMDHMLDGYEGTDIFTNARGQEVMNSAMVVPLSGWRLVITVPTRDAFSPIQEMQQHMLLAALLATLIAAALMWWMLRRELSPLLTAAQALARQSEANHPPQALQVGRRDEIGRLISGFNGLLATLEHREAVLVASELRFSSLIEKNNANILQIDAANGQIMDANAAACRFYGWPLAQMREKTIQSINALDPAIVAAEMVAASTAQRNVFIFPHRLASGEIRTVEVYSTPIEVGARRILVSIIHDISERVRHEEMTAHLLREQKAMLDSDFVGIVKIQRQKIQWANRAFHQMLGYEPDELIGQPTSLCYPNEHAYAEFEQEAFPSMRKGETYRADLQLIGKNAQLGWYALHTGFSSAGGDELIGVMIDVTLRKKAEAALLKSESFNRSILNSVRSHIAVIDCDGVILAVNDQWLQFSMDNSIDIGTAAAHTQVGANYLSICQASADGISNSAQDARAGIIAVMEGALPNFSLEYPCHSQHQQRWFEMTVTPLGQYMQDGVVIVHNNITERKQVEEALAVHRVELEKWESIQRLRELVVQNEKAREEERKYVAQELHDELGQVLTAVRMALLLMELRFCPDDAALAKVVADMKGLLDRAIQGTRDVVLHLRPTALDGGLVSALKWLSQDFFKRTGIACGLHIDDAHITVDETRSIVIFRIVQESLTNITRYAEASGAHIAVSQCDGALVLEISDDGKGFDVAAVGTRNTFGLLGMRERAKALGGRIDIVSTPLDGTTVRVTIPMDFENARKTP